MLPLRQALLLGDPRALYIALLANQDRLEIETYIKSLPVPANLKNLTPALRNFAGFFELDPALLKRAAEQSPDIVENPLDLTRLSEDERNAFLRRVINNDSLVSIEVHNLLIQKMAK